MKTKNLTLGSLFVTMIIILLYISSIIPTSKITLLAVVSSIIPLTLVKTNTKTAILVYIASSILSFFLVSKSIAIIYILFFGNYGLIKNFIEKFKNMFLEIFLKLLFFNSILTICYFLYNNLLLSYFNISTPFIYIILLSQVFFLIFDYALTVIISFYIKKLIH
ncbi:hypothetical protein SAMN02745163_00878 [Clostridium cavendishii DSM 21758]|uniref:Uncharacterized protein n=1 Tax=Clostridium cavendishii DSM 21758 TaxID=1121302 RepID=A0A1M6EL00_9CLOT|nr:hypothetical protein [Clostridium cavendishii]SHI86133.1 hypothetical protein SAMN02745163_00878 [Clostridium cavendishii DSM 21758]